MKKTIVGITAAAFLGGTAVTVTPVPAAALYPIFLGLVQPNPTAGSAVIGPWSRQSPCDEVFRRIEVSSARV